MNNNNNTPTEKRKTFFGFGKRKSSTSSTSSNPNSNNTKKYKKSFFSRKSKKSNTVVVPKSMTKSESNLQMKKLHREYREEQKKKFKNAALRLGNTSYSNNNNYEFIGAENPYAELFSNKNSSSSLNSGYSGSRSRSSLNSGYSGSRSSLSSNTNSLNNKNNIPNLPNLPTVPSLERLNNLRKKRLPEKMAIEKQNIKEEINILTNLIDRNLPLDENTKYKNEIISTICKYNEDIKKKQEQLAKLNL